MLDIEVIITIIIIIIFRKARQPGDDKKLNKVIADENQERPAYGTQKTGGQTWES